MPELLSEKEYVASGGCVCPSCGSKDIEAMGHAQIMGNFGYQPVRCNVCPFEWADNLELVGYELAD